MCKQTPRKSEIWAPRYLKWFRTSMTVSMAGQWVLASHCLAFWVDAKLNYFLIEILAPISLKYWWVRLRVLAKVYMS